MLCEITGDCADACDGGTRQMGLLRSTDDLLVFAQKNGQTALSGAAADLAPCCKQTVKVDGTLSECEIRMRLS